MIIIEAYDKRCWCSFLIKTQADNVCLAYEKYVHLIIIIILTSLTFIALITSHINYMNAIFHTA